MMSEGEQTLQPAAAGSSSSRVKGEGEPSAALLAVAPTNAQCKYKDSCMRVIKCPTKK